MAGLLISAGFWKHNAAEDWSALHLAAARSPYILSDAIRLAAPEPAVPLMARYKLENGGLLLTVWVAEKGFLEDPSYNVLKQRVGTAHRDKWSPKEVVFTDAERIAKAAYQWTIWATAETTLLDVVTMAEKKGRVLIAEPRFEGRKPFVRLVLHDGTRVQEMRYDLRTGDLARR